MAEPTDAQIIAQHTRLGFPGLDKFYVHIRRWAPTQELEVPTKARGRGLIAKRSTPQVFAQPKSSKGHHTSLGPGMYQADLASFQDENWAGDAVTVQRERSRTEGEREGSGKPLRCEHGVAR